MKKLIITLGILFTGFLNAQTDYAFLVFTTINNNPSGDGFVFLDLDIDGNNSGNIANYLNESSGQTFTDFVYIPNDFIQAGVRFRSQILTNSPCSRDGLVTFDKATFGRDTPEMFNSCISNSAIFSIYQEPPTAQESTICPTDTFVLAYGWNWQYRTIKNANTGNWTNFPSSYQERRSLIDVSLTDFLSTTELNGLTSIQIRTGYDTQFTTPIVYDVIACSPNLLDTSPSNTSCFDSNDGSVTLTFDGDVETANGYQMRYFIYQGNPADFNNNDLENPFPPQAYDEILGVTLTDNGNGGFNGSSNSNLENGDYYIVYQEVKYDGLNVTVKSGEITPQFPISRPTQIDLSTTSTIQPQCAGETGEATLSAVGGQDFETGNYQYSKDNGTTWQTSPTFSNLAQGQNYTFNTKLVLAGGECSGANTVQITINEVLNTISVNPGSGWLQQPSTTTATDGSLRVIITNGNPNYTYELFDANDLKLNEITGSTNTVEDFTNLGVGTYYVTVTDSNGCQATSADIILAAVPVPVLGTPTITQITCSGDTNGAISIPISGGTQPYVYAWTLNGAPFDSGTSSNPTIILTNLDDGTYRLIAASNGVDLSNTAATVTTEVTLNNPDEVIIQNATGNSMSCNGATDGSIAIVATGGTSYEYFVDNLSTNWAQLINNTIPIPNSGFYRITIRNENGCESNPVLNILVEEPNELLVSELTQNHQNVSTSGGNDGAIEINVQGGTTVYSYSWTGPNGFTAATKDINDLFAGAYQVTITDANSCTATLDNAIVVTEPGPLGITALNGTNASCNGSATGSITAVVTGIPPFTYTWALQGDPGFTAPNLPTITDLVAGTYTLRLTDASNLPEVTDTVTISEPSNAMNVTVTPSQTSCFGGNDGNIQITATNGTPPYEYAIDDGFGFQTGDTFTNLSPRTYIATVKDSNGCEFNTTTEVTQPVAITVTNVITNVSVSGGTDGAISITVNDGTPPYTFSWSGPNGYTNTAKDITGLATGTYTLEIRDANHTTDNSGCYFAQDFTLNEPGPLSINSLTVVDVECKGSSTGSITANVTGTAPIQYVWALDGTVIVGENQPSLINIGAGNYALTITDATTTPAVSQNVTVTEPLEGVTAVGLTFEVNCFGGNDGSVQINATGGTGPYTYSLDGVNFQAGNTFPNRAAGSYTAIVRDAGNCEFTIPTPIVVTQPQEMGLVIDELGSLSAANATDGIIRITASGGTGILTYSWTGPNNFTATTDDITNLAGGTYTLIITDENYNDATDVGCTFTQDFIIAEPGQLIVTIDQTVLLECNGDDFGELMANVQGGVAPYTYEWFKIENNNNTTIAEDTEILANLLAGEYFVRVTDANNIVVDAIPFEITQPALLEIIVDGTTDVLCNEAETGAIAISVSGGTAPYQYFWSNGATTEDLANIPAGEYTLEVVDANACLAQQTITVNPAPDTLRITEATITNISEFEANDGSIVLDIAGGSPPYTIAWIRLSDNSNAGDQAAISNLAADLYEVSISDTNGCVLTETYEVTQPDIVEETIVQPTCMGDSDGSIAVVVNGGNGSFTYSWNTGATTNSISNLSAGSYTVTITGFGNGPLTRTYVIEDPLPLSVDLGENRVLCADQELVLDATVEDETATYTWTSDNGFSSMESSITLTTTGNYTVTVSTASGCTATGTIFVDISTAEINAEFAMSSQVFVGEKVLGVDISFPLPETIEWVFPEEATVIKQDTDEIELTFKEAGEYEIGIITTRGDCIAQKTKKIIVVEKDATIQEEDTENGKKLIEEFLIYPNPTSGKFTADVNLTERGNISIKVFSLTNNAMMASEKDRGKTAYSIPFDLSGLPSGVYAVLLETPYGDTLRKIVIK